MLMKFLQTQNSMWLPAWVVGITSVVNIGLTYLMTETMGFVGAAHATTLSRVLQVRVCVCVFL